MTRKLPADVARCPGAGDDASGWRKDCERCLRRTTPPIDHPRVAYMMPPTVVALTCEYLIEDTP